MSRTSVTPRVSVASLVTRPCVATPNAGLLSALLLSAGLLSAAPAAAQDEVAGSVRAHVLASPEEDFGGGVSADLWFPIDWFRIGGFIGVGAIFSEEDVRNRVFMPVGLSTGFEVLGDVVGVSVRARGGFWGGATQENKLTAGGFLGLGAYLLVVLGHGAALDVGFDVWGIVGDGDTAVFAPSLGLSWSPADE